MVCCLARTRRRWRPGGVHDAKGANDVLVRARTSTDMVHASMEHISW